MFIRLVTIAAVLLVIHHAATTAEPGGTRSSHPAPTRSKDIDRLLTAIPADPTKVLGNDTCIKCHASEVKVWKRTPHAHTFDELHRRPEARQIATRLGLRSIKHEGRCVACHYTQQDSSGRAHAIAGVSCESCHGAARDWIDLHHDYGGEGITRQMETAEHRLTRLQRSISAGMRNPDNLYLMAQSCYRCHTTADEELVNVGGHSVGSLDFEIVAWSQGTIRHNFVRTDGKSNDVSSPQRLRVLFVAGIMADLEASLRATAVATEKATYGINAAQRAARATARLKSVSEKIDDKYVAAAVKLASGVPLKLNQREVLIDAAGKIAKLGYLFAMKANGEQMQALDAFLPSPDQMR